MQTELNRAKTDWRRADPSPYYLSYTKRPDMIVIAGSYGGLLTDLVRRRTADVVMRWYGRFDNTHGQSRASGMTSGPLPLDDDGDATARLCGIDRSRLQASVFAHLCQNNTAVRAEEEDKFGFSKRSAQGACREKLTPARIDRTA
jgi:hypothetical protein